MGMFENEKEQSLRDTVYLDNGTVVDVTYDDSEADEDFCVWMLKDKELLRIPTQNISLITLDCSFVEVRKEAQR